jgi:hypothetical protein
VRTDDQDEDHKRNDLLTCAAFKDLAGAFALDALDPGERLACARHLARAEGHAGCAEAVLEAQLVTAQLAAVLPARPLPPRTWDAIEARLAENAPADPAARGRRLWELADWLVAATVIGLYLYGAPVDARRPATVETEPPVRRTAQVQRP